MTLLTFVVVLFYSFACYSFGILLLAGLMQHWKELKVNDIGVVGSAFALGYGVLALIWTWLALAGYLTLFAVIAVLSIALLVGFLSGRVTKYSPLAHLLRSIGAVARDAPFAWVLIAILIILMLLLTGLASLLPPQPRGDALAFYMALPKLMAHTGQLTLFPGYEAFMQSTTLMGELHFAGLFMLDSMFAAKLFAWVVSVSAALILVGLAKEAGIGYRGQLLVLAAVFSSTVFTNLIWDGKVDAFAMGPASAAFLWVSRIKEDTSDTDTRKLLFIAGLFLGLAIMAKFSYLVFLPISVALLTTWKLATRRQEPLFSWARMWPLVSFFIVLGLGSALPLLTNVMRNAILYSAPLAPLINNGTNVATGYLAASRFSPEVVRHINSIYPLSVTYGLFQYQGGTVSPLVVGFIPVVILVWRSFVRSTSPSLQLLCVAVVGIVVWSIVLPGVFILRYYMPLFLLVIVFAAGVIDHLFGAKPYLPQITRAVVLATVIMLLMALHDIYPNAVDGLQHAAGANSACSMEEMNNDASCRIAAVINQEAQPGERVFMASFYTYWLDPELLKCIPTAAEATQIRRLVAGDNTESEIWEALYREGYRYVIIDPYTHADWNAKLTLTSVPETLTVEPILNLDYGKAYRIRSKDNELDLPSECTSSIPGCCPPVE